MTTTKDLLNTMNETIDYKNFSEEVVVLSEVVAGNHSLYTVINKNSVNFQNVTGSSGIKSRGILGFIDNNRARPTLIGASTKHNLTESLAAYTWDVQLVVTDADSNTDTETKTNFITSDPPPWSTVNDIT